MMTDYLLSSRVAPIVGASVPSVGVPGVWDGEPVVNYVEDESGEALRALRLADYCSQQHGADLGSWVGGERPEMLPGYMEHLDWAAFCESDPQDACARHYVDVQAVDALAWGDFESLFVLGGATVEAAQAAAQARDVLPLPLGLVSVLSTHKRLSEPANLLCSALEKRSSKKIKPSATLLAKRAAIASSVGAFVAGGAAARMAKLRMAIGYSARCHGASHNGFRADKVVMVTVTYADSDGWEPSHIRSLMTSIRNWHDRNGIKCRYVWISEPQDGKRRKDGVGRDAIHYHIALWMPKGSFLPAPDKQGWWAHGSSKTEIAKGAVEYLMSYFKKANAESLGKLPGGARAYSVGGLDHSMRRSRRWLNLPKFVQANSSINDKWVRAEVGTGGGWVAPDGTRWASEFKRVNCGGGIALMRVLTHPCSMSGDMTPGGPFSWIK